MSADAAAAIIRERAGFEPDVAIVLGSGIGGLAGQVENPVVVSYADLPGFPRPTVEGHAGELILGDLGGRKVACMNGRMHYYEGHPLSELAVPVRALRRAGCDILFLTNAAGSTREHMPPGSLMALSDHINLVGTNPLVGPNDDSFGPRFFDMSRAWDPELRELLQDCAGQIGFTLHEGVYAWYSGPNFETPAEIRAFRTLGADAVGMSTVPECLVGVHAGMRVVGVSNITNLAAGMTRDILSHEETLANAALGAENLQRLIVAFLQQLSLS